MECTSLIFLFYPFSQRKEIPPIPCQTVGSPLCGRKHNISLLLYHIFQSGCNICRQNLRINGYRIIFIKSPLSMYNVSIDVDMKWYVSISENSGVTFLNRNRKRQGQGVTAAGPYSLSGGSPSFSRRGQQAPNNGTALRLPLPSSGRIPYRFCSSGPDQ